MQQVLIDYVKVLEDRDKLVYDLVRLALDGRTTDVAMLARRYARKMENKEAANKLCSMVAASGYGPSILRKR